MQTAPVMLAGEAEAAAPHERLVRVAREMFCRDGIHATGIESILAEAGVSKMTLYSRFGSKEALVREALRQEGAAWRADFFARVEASAAVPGKRLGHVMGALDGWFRSERFYGCAFINAVAEHSKGERWLRELAAEHHRVLVGYLAGLAEAAGAAEPVTVARQVMLLIDGAIAALMVSGDLSVIALSERNLQAVLALGLAAEAVPAEGGLR